mgnify:CR=1 FL=1
MNDIGLVENMYIIQKFTSKKINEESPSPLPYKKISL